ncbi:hypothetical protein COCSADRAFT_117484 [Bipolaris sorokiniana ND90Pr]|uniref:Rhodopsin domain-containing protein n=1 Tax=Cochliobolus sativus (strain ND90Pr / ATCC 201652) TaxID=665912 RepID=M2RBR7_COCSN|nr:uncharacterized protein COCSADRAFT_117484 [Bipolaris sorokiniana ND90Pr]EMD64289.1 hypothetical protein COCSADRAFT_117484 [Bipolaris sorokiniana ND90Pr]
MPSYPLQLTCLGVIIGTPLLASIFVILRIYTRRKLNLRLSWDDWLIILPLLLSIALIGPSYRHVKMWHVGVHIWQVPPDEIEPNYDQYYAVVMAFNLLNIPILPLVKASIILLLLRAGSVIQWLRRALYAILIFTVGSALIPWCLYIFICPPLTGNTWKPRTFGGLHCMGRHKMGEMLIWVTCANLLTDVLILPIPFIIVRRMMSARLRSRLVVLAVFTCSLAVTAIGAAKIYLSYRDRLYTLFKPDWTYPIDYCINHIENNVAIIVANIPILRGLVTRWIFNFRTKATPMDPEARTDNNWQQWDLSSSSAGDSRYTRRNSKKSVKVRMFNKILPCIQDDFSSSLATRTSTSGDATTNKAGASAHITECKKPRLPSKIVTNNPPKRTYFSRPSRRNSQDRYAASSHCEKGDANVLESVRSVGSSLESAPTLVDSKYGRGSMGCKSLELDSPPVSPTTVVPGRRYSAATLLHSPITPLSPVRLRGIGDAGEYDEYDDDEGIYPHHPRTRSWGEETRRL